MKLKYYLRGIGIGVIVTTLILMIAYGQHKVELTDAEIIRRAEALGMVPKEQIESVSIQVKIPEPQVEVKVSIWDQLGTFLTGLFA